MTAVSPPSIAASEMRSASGLRLASPLVRRESGMAGTGSPSVLARVTAWLGADWRGVTAGVVLGIFGFGAGLAGGLGLGDAGLSAEDILVSASVSDVFAFNTTTGSADLTTTDAFESVFSSIQ